MKSMQPMKPMQGEPQWWPGKLGSPSSSGAQISGVQQRRGAGDDLLFTSQSGTVDLKQLQPVR